ncbi:MAG: hypothetical protein WB522_00740, partial [Pseudolabrys sp.]
VFTTPVFPGQLLGPHTLTKNLPIATAKSGTQCKSNQSPASFSEIREYFKFSAEIFSLLLP